MTTQSQLFTICRTSLGKVYLLGSQHALHAVFFEEQWGKFLTDNPQIKGGSTAIFEQAKRELQEYFDGRRKEFRIPFELEGTDFQKKTWKALAAIPYGQTWTYKEQAIHIGNEKAVRAVGMTNGKNPLPIILPCHRVIGSNKKLTGYAGGLKAKKFLLSLEGCSFES